MKNIVLPLASIALLLGPGCLLHIGDPENRYTRSAEAELSAPPGATVTQRFRVTVDEVGAPRLLDFAARASVRDGAGGEIALRLRDLGTGEEVVVESTAHDELLLECDTTGACSAELEAELSRVDDAETTWTGRLRVEGTGRVTCCGDFPGELTVELIDE